MEKDAHVKLLTYKIKLDGAVTVDTPAVAVEVAAAQSAPPSARMVGRDTRALLAGVR